jgi:uncharacterized protein
MTGRMVAALLAIVIAAPAACERGSAGDETAQVQQTAGQQSTVSVRFDTTTAYVRTAGSSFTLRVEVAERGDQRTFGLMDRSSLHDDAGMIFVYDEVQSPESGFWMYRTLIPLDIAFFDGAGRIVAILQMDPCPTLDSSRCPTYAPGRAYFGALEVNRGWFSRRGVRVGDRIVVPGRVGG